MAASGTWSVFIAADDPALERVYRMLSGTTVSEVMEKWRDDNELLGNWLFASDNSETVFADFMTLEMIGETSRNSKIVTLRAVLAPQPEMPSLEIFVCSDDDCTAMRVAPHRRLRSALQGTRCGTLESDGQALDWSRTVEEARLAGGAVICAPRTRVAVRLSSGAVASLSLPAHALVSHLQDSVSRLERGECALRYCGRELRAGEPVRKFRRTVEVFRAKFTVILGDRQWTWTAGSGAIKFGEFIAQLSKESDRPRSDFQDLTFACAGCNRGVSRAQADFQVIHVQCCRQESLTLLAKCPSLKREKLTQTTVDTRKRGVQCEPETAEKLTQTTVYTLESGVQCEPETAEFSTQTACNGRQVAVQTQCLSDEISTQTECEQQHKTVQTQDLRGVGFESAAQGGTNSLAPGFVSKRGIQKDLSTQTQLQVHEIGIQYEHFAAEFSSDDLVTIPLRLYNWTDTGLYQGKWSNVDIQLPLKPTIGELRTAVSLHLCRLSQKTMIERCVGVSKGGQRVYDIWDKDGPFSCANGRLFKWNEVKDVSYEKLTDDNATFIIPLGRRIKLEVHPR